MTDRGITPPFAVDAVDSLGTPDDDVTTTLDVSPWVETKLASLACHRTQISDDGPFSRLPEDVVHTLMGTEFYQLVSPPGAVDLLGGAVTRRRYRRRGTPHCQAAECSIKSYPTILTAATEHNTRIRIMAQESFSQDLDKLIEAALYLGERSENDPYFGVSKLARLLYYSDCGAYILLGAPITGTTYLHFPHGPYPENWHQARAKMEKSGAITVLRDSHAKAITATVC